MAKETEEISPELRAFYEQVGLINSLHSLLESQAFSLLGTLLNEPDVGVLKALMRKARQLGDKMEVLDEVFRIKVAEPKLLKKWNWFAKEVRELNADRGNVTHAVVWESNRGTDQVQVLLGRALFHPEFSKGKKLAIEEVRAVADRYANVAFGLTSFAADVSENLGHKLVIFIRR